MHDFKITAMTPELLHERFPEVYDAIFQDGFSRGQISGKAEGERAGREQGQRYAEAMAKAQPELTKAEESAKNGKYFEMLAKQYMRENKCSIGKAMMACAKLYPSEHLDFINRTNPK